MYCVPIGLLLFFTPTYSYQNACCQQSKNLAKKSINCHIRSTKRELWDREDPTADTLKLLDEQSSDKQIFQSKAMRTDNNKAKNLLTKDWEFPNAIEDIRCYLAVNDSFVPVIGVHKRETFIKLRSFLFGQGVYPGVEYKILNITIFNNNSDNRDDSNTSNDSVNSDTLREGSQATGVNKGKEVNTLQGILQRGNGDTTLDDSSSTWISRLFSGQTQLIQTSGSDSSVIIDADENASVGLTSYREEEDYVELTVRPAYPLIKELEKKWPVKVTLTHALHSMCGLIIVFIRCVV